MFNFNHVTISVDNLENTLEFYNKFGFKIYKEYHNESVDIIMLKLKNMILEIFHYQEKEQLLVEDNNLNDKEIIINKGRLGKPYFFIKDPNGILMELIEED